MTGYVVDGKNQNPSTSLQIEMLRAGLAFVYPPTGSEPHLDDMIKAEQEARQNRRGIWSDPSYADVPADKAREKYGHYVFVTGVVVKAERIKNKVYLNFGANWRTDFAVVIAVHDLHNFRTTNIDPLTYQGKTVRVRGWVKRDSDPMITVTNPGQITLMP